ncbi:hypothetical protein AB0J80_36985 [Actinoplanes sp. NPDC049548]
MKRQLLAMGVGALFPLIAVAVVAVAAVVDAAAHGVQRLTHR